MLIINFFVVKSIASLFIFSVIFSTYLSLIHNINVIQVPFGSGIASLDTIVVEK